MAVLTGGLDLQSYRSWTKLILYFVVDRGIMCANRNGVVSYFLVSRQIHILVYSVRLGNQPTTPREAFIDRSDDLEQLRVT